MPKDVRNSLLRRRLLAAVMALGLSQALFAAPPGQAQDTAVNPSALVPDYTQPGQLVALADGRHINLRCTGTGKTTVILDAGGGTFSLAWRLVQGEVAKFTRVCSYDRAGYGFSDANTRPSTGTNIVDDLHQTLAAAGIRAPLLLVGHSAGGQYMTLYAETHPEDVAGLVLIDPGFATWSHDMVTMGWSAYPDLLAKRRADQAAHTVLMQTCVKRLRSGVYKTGDLGECDCMDTTYMPELADYVHRYCRGPKQFEGMIAEEAAGLGKIGDWPSQTEQELASAQRSFGAMPVTILAHGRAMSFADNDDLNARMEIIWRGGLVGLAAQSERGKVVVVQNSGHSIQLEQPDAVIGAIHEMLDGLSAPSDGVRQ